MPRVDSCIFIAYLYAQTTYTVLTLTLNKIFISRDIKLFEDMFHLHSLHGICYYTSITSYVPIFCSNHLPKNEPFLENTENTAAWNLDNASNNEEIPVNVAPDFPS